MSVMYARTANVLLGSWLVVSAFVWPHTRPQLDNTVIAGILCFAVALVAVVHSPARRWNLLLGAWVVVSSVVLPGHLLTAVHNALVGAAMFALALVRTPGWQPPVTLENRLREVANGLARAR
jgi:hypothetical protein